MQGNTIEATLDIGVLGFHQSFRTRNTLQRPERIGIDFVSGPFRRLRGEWRFVPAPGGGADISLTLTFEVTLSPFGVVFAKVFEELAASQMTAFVDARQEESTARARDCCARPRSGVSWSSRLQLEVAIDACDAVVLEVDDDPAPVGVGERPRRK